MNENIRSIKPIGRVHARIRLPGSKSITHRALMMACLAAGPGEILNPLRAEDTLLTANALKQLGAAVEWRDNSVVVAPPARRWNQPVEPIFLGNSGTSTRFLIALAAAGTGTFILDGIPRLRERPVGPAAEALKALGVTVRWLDKTGFPPVEITSCGLSGGDVTVDASRSSQFLSGLLLAAPTARRELRIAWPEPAASFPYVAMTLGMMQNAGIRFEQTGSHAITVPAPQVYAPGNITVEGDCSSASYFWGAAAITGGEIVTAPISSKSLQGDCRLLDVIAKMGCLIDWQPEGVRVRGPARLAAIDIDMNEMPDMVPTLAVLAAFADGTSRIRNVAHLRIKESDRLAAMAAGLKMLHVGIEEFEDGLLIRGGNPSAPSAPIPARSDHRIAMAFAIAGLRLDGVAIQGADSVAKSFPDFWSYLENLANEHI